MAEQPKGRLVDVELVRRKRLLEQSLTPAIGGGRVACGFRIVTHAEEPQLRSEASPCITRDRVVDPAPRAAHVLSVGRNGLRSRGSGREDEAEEQWGEEPSEGTNALPVYAATPAELIEGCQ